MVGKSVQKPRQRYFDFPIAQNPVMGLWTACTRLKKQLVAGVVFRLTIFTGGVKQDRSLTAS